MGLLCAVCSPALLGYWLCRLTWRMSSHALLPGSQFSSGLNHFCCLQSAKAGDKASPGQGVEDTAMG